jgi:hypothetical protein
VTAAAAAATMAMAAAVVAAHATQAATVSSGLLKWGARSYKEDGLPEVVRDYQLKG